MGMVFEMLTFAAFAIATRLLPIFPEASQQEQAEPDEGEPQALGESVPA